MPRRESKESNSKMSKKKRGGKLYVTYMERDPPPHVSACQKPVDGWKIYDVDFASLKLFCQSD